MYLLLQQRSHESQQYLRKIVTQLLIDKSCVPLFINRTHPGVSGVWFIMPIHCWIENRQGQGRRTITTLLVISQGVLITFLQCLMLHYLHNGSNYECTSKKEISYKTSWSFDASIMLYMNYNAPWLNSFWRSVHWQVLDFQRQYYSTANNELKI